MASLASPERRPTGVPGLDTILNGGLLRGSAYILHGPPGAGKTILANQIAFEHAGRGDVALYVSLLAESHDRMIAFMGRMGFCLTDRMPDRLSYLSAYSTLQKAGLAGVARLLSTEARRRGATLIVLDGLFVLHDAADSEQQFRQFVHEVSGQAAVLGATLLLLTNQRRDASSPEYTMVDGWIELHDDPHELRSRRSLQVHKQRGGSYLRGRHFFRISDAGIVLFPRFEADVAPTEAPDISGERATSGVPELDTMLHGGYPCASATLLYGPTGAGKTTLGLQFAGEATPEAPALIFGFYETPRRIVAKAAALGLDFQGLIDRGALAIDWRSPAENLIDEICGDIVAAVERTGARRVFVDGLAAFRTALMFPARLPLVVNALNHRLRGLGATVVYTLEHRELYLPESLGTDTLSEIVDNVVLVHYALRQGILRRNLTILKVRDSDFDAISEEFHVTGNGVRFGERAEPERRPAGALPDPRTGENTQQGVTRRSGRKDG